MKDKRSLLITICLAVISGMSAGCVVMGLIGEDARFAVSATFGGSTLALFIYFTVIRGWKDG